MPETPSLPPTRKGGVLPRSPLGDFELRPKTKPPAIEVPDGAGSDDDSSQHGYTSLRDILSTPEYVAGHVSFGDVHMIRHPLLKRAAYAYLQMTPSAREDPRRRWRRLLLGCVSFIGGFFRP
jgi:hypothetical protein